MRANRRAARETLACAAVGGVRSEEERIRAAYARRPVEDWRYSPFNPAHLLAMQQLETGMLALLRRNRRTQLSSYRVLDVGCGAGRLLNRLLGWGAAPANLAGVDLLPDRIAEARSLLPAEVRLICASARQLEFPAESFDLIFQLTVFTSILDPELKRQIAAEMLRVLRPEGLIVWFDYHMNNPRNPDVRGVGKQKIRELFPGCRIELRRITLAPPINRLLAPWSPLLCQLLSRAPFLCTHYLGGICKASSGRGIGPSLTAE